MPTFVHAKYDESGNTIFDPTFNRQQATIVLDPTLKTVGIAGGGQVRSIQSPAEKFYSLCASGNSIGVHVYGNSFAVAQTHLSSFAGKSSGGLYLAKNSGVGGYRSDQVLAKMQAEGFIDGSQIVAYGEGTNDASQSVSTAAHMANIKAMTDLILASGRTPLLIMTPPGDYANNALTHPYWVAEWVYCNINGIAAIDAFGRYVDTDGTWVSGASTDTTHPILSVYAQAGLDMWSAATSKAPPLLLPRTNAGQGIFGNALNLTDTNADGLPDGWSVLSLTGQTYNALSDFAYPYRGKKASINVSQSSAGYVYKQSATGFAVGDKVRASGVLAVTAATNMIVDVYIRANGSGAFDWFASTLAAVTGDTYFSTELVVPAGTTSLQMYFRVSPLVAGAFSGTLTWGDCDIYNITTNSLV
jgi:hypothetical protein